MKEFYGCWSPQNEEMYRSVKAMRNIALMGGLFATLSLTSLALSSSLLPLSQLYQLFPDSNCGSSNTKYSLSALSTIFLLSLGYLFLPLEKSAQALSL